MDINKIKKAHLIGIKGVGMTMLAQYLAARGIGISGSDGPEKFMTDPVLEKIGIAVKEKFQPDNIPAEADLIVYSTAYKPETNPELAAALAGRARVLSLPEAIAQIFNQKYGLAVAGSHGKTTTTAWLAYVLKQAGFDPNAMIGAYVPQLSGFSLVGASDYLILELDEYQNKFRFFQPRALLLNNIDWDHPDFFPTPASYEAVFIALIKKIPKSGFLIANFDDPKIRKYARANCPGRVVSYGLSESADYRAEQIRFDQSGQYFQVKYSPAEADGQAEDLGSFFINLSGRHNIANALAVIAAAVELEVPLAKIRAAVGEFSGPARRLQLLGEFNGAAVIDDYAHHPSEIAATICGLRERYPGKRLLVVFHPHTFSRTKALLADFAASLSAADQIAVLDIYGSAREQQGGVHSADLVGLINKKKRERGEAETAQYLPAQAQAEQWLRAQAGAGDVVTLMGAGDVFRIGERLLI